MSPALWGFLGVGVGAAVTFGTTWWQLKRSRESEDRAHERERAARRSDSEALAIQELQEKLAEWVDRLGALGCGDSDTSTLDVLLRISYLKQRVDDSDARAAITELVGAGLEWAAAICRTPVLDDEDSAVTDAFTGAYDGVQALLGERFRRLK